MKDLLKAYENRAPEIVFAWQDSETEARGWVVINSLRGGAAGGGTRMRKGLDQREVESLAKTMEVKFTVSGPHIGGAKSGIDFDPSDPRKKGVLERWYKAVTPLLKHYYGTGGDLNVDEIHEVIPMTEANGVWHPQEGVFTGHFQPNEAQKVRRIGNLRQGVSQPVEDATISPDVDRKIRVADLITGYGVSESVRHLYDLRGDNVEGKRVVVQGWGNVGAAAALYLAQAGASIVGIIDRVGGVLRPEGLTYEEVKELFLAKEGNALAHQRTRAFRRRERAHLGLGTRGVLAVRGESLGHPGPGRAHGEGRGGSDFFRGQRAVCGQGDFLRPDRRMGGRPHHRDSGFHRQLRHGPGLCLPHERRRRRHVRRGNF